jgi:large subunit ribosomal protein L22
MPKNSKKTKTEKKEERSKAEFKVFVKELPYTPRKMRLVVDVVRGKEVTEALNKLQFLNKKGAKMVIKAIKSGVANAENQAGLSAEDLKVGEIYADESSNKYMKRYQFASRGRIARIVKRRSNLNLVLVEK